MSEKVYVAMSGGVDSSVSAMILKKQGFDVVGVYMKNWAKDIPGFNCPWEQDLVDADAVAAQLGINFEVFDFQDEYKYKVVDYMLDGYKKGITPNPDIMCNQEIKFKLFLDVAMEKGADKIATGHYAKTKDGQLFTSKDASKDQTYFLYRVSTQAFKKSIFPLGDKLKLEVRKLADKAKLITAQKKDSVGLCFVGDVQIKDFLNEYVDDIKPGPLIDQNGNEVGQHEGAIYYTIGQRHGLGIGGGLPFYVVDKDMSNNTVYVTTNLDDDKLWSEKLNLIEPHWVSATPEKNKLYNLKIRYVKNHVKASITDINSKKVLVKLDGPVKAAAPGQSAVFYEGDLVLGGGIISTL